MPFIHYGRKQGMQKYQKVRNGRMSKKLERGLKKERERKSREQSEPWQAIKCDNK